MAIFQWGPPNGGVEYRCGRQKWRFSTIICDWWSANNNCDCPPCSLPYSQRCITYVGLNLCLSQPACMHAWTTTAKRS